MIFSKLATIAIAILLFVPTASAGPKKKKTKAKPSAASEVQEKGPCERTGSSTRRCFVDGISAELHINISKSDSVIVILEDDERPNFTSKDKYISRKVNKSFIVFKLLATPPKAHNVILRTKSMTLTLYFHVVKSGSDSQIHIQRSDRGRQDAEVEARVAAKIAALDNEFAEKLDGLDFKAKQIATADLLNQVFSYGSYTGRPRGNVIERNDSLVVRATGVVRVGKQRILQISVEERKGSTFIFGAMSATLAQGKAERSLKVAYKCKEQSVRPGQKVDCTLALGEIDKAKGRALVSLTIRGARQQRAVSLKKIDIQ